MSSSEEAAVSCHSNSPNTQGDTSQEVSKNNENCQKDEAEATSSVTAKDENETAHKDTSGETRRRLSSQATNGSASLKAKGDTEEAATNVKNPVEKSSSQLPLDRQDSLGSQHSPSVELASSSDEEERMKTFRRPVESDDSRVRLLGSQSLAPDEELDRTASRPHVEEPEDSESSDDDQDSLLKAQQPSVLFFHLDLGIGGAERLIVCMAQATGRNYRTTVATTRFSPLHCFPECKEGYFRILSFGKFIPRDFCGMFTALFSIIRLLVLFCYLIYRRLIFGEIYDIVINDQLAMFNPLLYMIGKKVGFYCHFPDPLMVNRYRTKLGSSLYRYGIDSLEKRGIHHCDQVWTNSDFTREKFRQVFDEKGVQKVQVLYPCVPLVSQDVTSDDLPDGIEANKYFLSLNRYEIKKNHLLAMLAFGIFANKHKDDSYKDYKLVICGGYDHSLLENQLAFLQLVEAIDHINGLDKVKVLLLRSATDKMRLALLKYATATLYTPSFEHFGIVPIESMSQGTPVIAVNSGGPMESVLNGVTGSLTEPKPEAFAEAMEIWKDSPQLDTNIACRKQAAEFSFSKFRLSVLTSLVELSKK